MSIDEWINKMWHRHTMEYLTKNKQCIDTYYNMDEL